MIVHRLLPLLLTLTLGACATADKLNRLAGNPEEMKLSDFVKSDIDMVVEVHQRRSLEHLRTLMRKLYRRNPAELRKSGLTDIEEAVARVFYTPLEQWQLPELEGRRGVDALRLAFHEEYQGDRVLALIAGLTSMLMAAYDYKTEFFVLDDLDPQKLYNAARNVEIAVWKLSNDRTSDGRLYLLSNSRPGEPANLSFERLFGKLIALQDSMALVISDKTRRAIKNVVQTLASAVFLPI
jgi:hypothetical protein